MKDQKTKCIKVEDMEAPVFKALLHFIYWDALPDMEELWDALPDMIDKEEFTGLNPKCAYTLMFQRLLAAADRYGLERLKVLCEAKLCEDFTINTVATTIAVAEQHHCCQLKYACLNFVGRNLRAVIQTDSFKCLKEKYPSIVTELLEYVATNNQHSSIAGKRGNEALLDGGDDNGRRVRRRHSA